MRTLSEKGTLSYTLKSSSLPISYSFLKFSIWKSGDSTHKNEKRIINQIKVSSER